MTCLIYGCKGTMSKPIRIIAAVARNGIIGKDGHLPWKIAEDWSYLCETVSGSIWIVGRRCYEEVGGAFPTAAKTIVLSRQDNLTYPDAIVASTLEKAIDEAIHCEDGSEIFIGGGVEVFKEAYMVASEILVTEIDKDFEGDLSMPPWKPFFPHCVSTRASSDENVSYSFNRYVKSLPVQCSDL